MIVKKSPDEKRFKHGKIVLIFVKYIIFVSRRSKNQPYTKGNRLNIAKKPKLLVWEVSIWSSLVSVLKLHAQPNI